MKSMLKTIKNNLRGIIDLFLSIVIIPSAFLLLIFRKRKASKFPMTTKVLRKIGVFPIRNHYYEPLFDVKLLSAPLDLDRHLPGIDFNLSKQLVLLKNLTFSNELIALDLRKKTKSIEDFYINNGSFESGDADFLYQIIRYIKPRKIIEIGSGNSTKIARLALMKNKSETNNDYEHICIEPFRHHSLEKLDSITVVPERIENCDFDWANELNEGDFLFVDSSHMIRPQGDVLKEYLEIFPQLKPGVYIHIHDIFTPKDYPKSWIVDDLRFWNEQYLLEALLTNTNRYEIVAALNLLKNHYYEDLSEVCPYLSKDREPGSFYIKVNDKI